MIPINTKNAQKAADDRQAVDEQISHREDEKGDRGLARVEPDNGAALLEREEKNAGDRAANIAQRGGQIFVETGARTRRCWRSGHVRSSARPSAGVRGGLPNSRRASSFNSAQKA